MLSIADTVSMRQTNQVPGAEWHSSLNAVNKTSVRIKSREYSTLLYHIFSPLFLSANLCWPQLHRDCLQTSCASSTILQSLLVCSPRNEQCVFLASLLNVCMWCHGIPLHYAAGIYFPANFYTLLIDNGSTPNLNSTLKQKESPTKCSALLALVGSRHTRGVWYRGWSSFWRRALPWLWKPADPTGFCRLEEMSAPRAREMCWGTLTRCATARPAGTKVSGRSSHKRLLHPCSAVWAPAQYLHYLEFTYGTVNRNYPAYLERWVEGRVQPQNRLVWMLLAVLRSWRSNACFSHFKLCCSTAGEDVGKYKSNSSLR